MIEELKQLIEESDTILITSHISPDGDSVSSSLLLYRTLKTNFPNKKITVSMEEQPFGLSFLDGYDDIKFQPLSQAISVEQPDLLFVLDANVLGRLTRQTDTSLGSTKIVVIDHHEGTPMAATLVINNSSPAVTLDIYEIFIEQLALSKPENYAQTALTGIYTDTGGFVHRNLNFNKVFDVVPKLIADGADLEKLVSDLSLISQDGLTVLAELLSNIVYTDGYIYSYISDETARPAKHEALVQASNSFRNNYIRYVEGRPWGFLVQKDVAVDSNIYSVSFRAQTDAVDVSLIAKQLGGGGHKPAAGAKFAASSIQEALDKVLSAIEQSGNS
jgi:phosphoesterase RecJ-like protein